MSELSGPDSMRASDQERDAVVEHLQSAFVEGRLDVTEYQSRLDAAMSARTLGELRQLTTDLPAPRLDPRKQELERAQKQREARLDEWRSWLGVAVVLNGIWLITCIVTMELLPYWPILPLGIWALINLTSSFDKRDRRDRRGGHDDRHGRNGRDGNSDDDDENRDDHRR
jgi:hypothetical protein